MRVYTSDNIYAYIYVYIELCCVTLSMPISVSRTI